MIRKVTKRNYRQFYKDYFGIEFGEEMDVHHLDFNRDNNDISNLLLIPNEVHNKFHLCCSNGIDTFSRYSNPRKLELKDGEGISYDIEMAKRYLEALHEIEIWYFWKNSNYDLCLDKRVVKNM